MSTPPAATASPLKGTVREHDSRVVRPGQSAKPANARSDASKKPLGSGLDDSSFSLPVSTKAKSLPAIQASIGATAMPDIPPPATPQFNDIFHTQTIKSTQPSGGSGASSVNTAPPAAPARRKIVIRLLQFRAGGHMQFAFEAAHMANLLLDKGADVTVLLDLDAVRAADKNDTMNAQYDRFPGTAASVRGRYASAQDLLTEFVQKGGKLVVSEKWAKLTSTVDDMNPLINGAKMLSDDEIADLFMDPAVVILGY